MNSLIVFMLVAISASSACQDNSVFCTKLMCIFSASRCPKTCGLCTTGGGDQCGVPSIAHGRVVAGDTAVRGSWPWQILMLRNKKGVCGGTLIDPQWVLSAAHCVKRNPDPTAYQIRAGEYNQNQREGSEETIQVEKVIYHKGFSYESRENDIALIKMSRPFKLSRHVKTACLPTQEVSAGTDCYITGWGKTRHPGQMTSILQQGKMEVVERRTCENYNIFSKPIKITDAMICAGSGGKDRISGCHGDSGGPFVCRIKGRWEVHGAVSFGSSRCDSRSSYSVFANVSKYLSWIAETKKNN